MNAFRAQVETLFVQIPTQFLYANPDISAAYGAHLELFLRSGTQHTLLLLEETLMRNSSIVMDRMMTWTARMLPRYGVLPMHLFTFWQVVWDQLNARLDDAAFGEIQPYLDFALSRQGELVKQFQQNPKELPDWRESSPLPERPLPLPLNQLLWVMHRWPGYERILDRLPRQPEDVKELYYFGLVSIMLQEERCRILHARYDGEMAYMLVELMTGEIFEVPYALVDQEFEREVQSQVRLLMAEAL